MESMAFRINYLWIQVLAPVSSRRPHRSPFILSLHFLICKMGQKTVPHRLSRRRQHGQGAWHTVGAHEWQLLTFSVHPEGREETGKKYLVQRGGYRPRRERAHKSARGTLPPWKMHSCI